MTEHPLTHFLRARYDDQESRARRAINGKANQFVEADRDTEPLLFNKAGEFDLPERVLADIGAKRKLLEMHPGATSEDECPGCGAHLDGTWVTPPEGTCPVLAILAEPYASHPDYPKDV